MGTRAVYTKMNQIRFVFVFFQSYGDEKGPNSYSQIRLSVSQQDYKNGFGAQIHLHQRYVTANNGFRTRRNYYHIWSITLLELKYIHNSLCQECGGYLQGYGPIEVHSFLLKRRESTLVARSDVLEMLEVKDGR